ncbi:MAG: PilN domain-containing protein, partial [Stenotrophomonas sp.]
MTGWRDSLVQARGRLAPGVGNGLRWWRRSLLAWLPVRWQWAMGWSRSRLLLSQQGDRLVVRRDTAAQVQPGVELPWPTVPADLEAVLDTRLRR